MNVILIKSKLVNYREEIQATILLGLTLMLVVLSHIVLAGTTPDNTSSQSANSSFAGGIIRWEEVSPQAAALDASNEFNASWDTFIVAQKIMPLSTESPWSDNLAQAATETTYNSKPSNTLSTTSVDRSSHYSRILSEPPKPELSFDTGSGDDDFITQEQLGNKSNSLMRSTPVGWPARYGYLSSGFGWRGKRMHKGVDIVAPRNASVHAVEEGIVSFVGVKHGYGNLVEIRHSATYATRYAHNTKNLVNLGDKVRKGQRIAFVGSTGRTNGTAHIHFEVLRAGIAINPMKYLGNIANFNLTETVKVSEK